MNLGYKFRVRAMDTPRFAHEIITAVKTGDAEKLTWLFEKKPEKVEDALAVYRGNNNFFRPSSLANAIISETLQGIMRLTRLKRLFHWRRSIPMTKNRC